MLYTPFVLPIALLVNLLSLAILGGGFYFLWAWYAGVVVGTGYLVGSIVAIALSFVGRFVVLAFWPAGRDDPSSRRSGRSVRIPGASLAGLNVEIQGPADAPPIIFTHGWGMDSTEWNYVKRQLAERFQIIVWDLPGLGKSPEPFDGHYSLERLAADLKAVIGLAGGRPAILVGHSIGGMTILTLCRLFPQLLGSSVAGIVLANSTDRTPTKTTTAAGLMDALLRPVWVPCST
jgi:pimeloyl-ACP methyl ester carboxylesterase